METKIAAHSTELEVAVVGSILKEPSCLTRVIAILKPECFYNQNIKEVFKAILTLDKRSEVIDILTVTQELKKSGKLEIAGGPFGVSSLTNKIIHALHVERHCLIVYQFFLLREMSGIGMKIHNLTHEPNADALEILSIIQRDLSTIDYIGKTNIETVGDVVYEILKQSIPESEQKQIEGIATGLGNVDKYFTKQKQELGIIMARPGMGKTAFLLALAKHTAVVLKKPVAIFSLEMSTKKLVGRLMASEAQIASNAINRNKMTAPEIMKLTGGVSRLFDAPIYFDDTADLKVMELRARIRRMVDLYGVEEVYIDYLQLISGSEKGNREQEISFVSRTLKKIAKEEDIPIIALSQLSREVEKRQNKKPQLGDLRESGAIEQDADWVLSLFRPEYYGIGNEHTGLYEEETFSGKHLRAENLLVCEALKYREGDLFKAALKFYGAIMTVENYDLDPNSNQLVAPLDNNNEFINQSPITI